MLYQHAYFTAEKKEKKRSHGAAKRVLALHNDSVAKFMGTQDCHGSVILRNN